jgi:hypothetical protein
MNVVKRALATPAIALVVSFAQSATAQSGATAALDDRVRRGLVLVEEHGAPVAVGTILGRDGRVLTALSGLAGATRVDLRYGSGSVVHASIGRSDEAADLVLLVPDSPMSVEGLDAGDVNPEGMDLHAMLPAQGGRLVSVSAEVHGDVAAHGQRSLPTVRMLQVLVHAAPLAGAPLLDASGRVVAVLVHACKVVPVFPAAPPRDGEEPLPLPPPPCVPEFMGAPVASIRWFLGEPAPATAPSLGIHGEPAVQANVRGVRVLAVAPSSAAERVGLHPNADVIVAADGRPVDSPEKLAGVIGKHAGGDTVKLLVLSDAGFRDVAVRLPGGRPR